MLLGSDEPKPSRKERSELNWVTLEWHSEKESKPSKQESKWPKVLTSTPWGAIYREEEVVVYIYSTGGVEDYKKVPKFYK